jgi:Na+/melibiose symporter-like transporter
LHDPDGAGRDARLSWPVLLGFGLPALPLTIVGVPLVLLVVPLYAHDLAVPAASVGIVFALARLLDGVIDPAVGILSDRMATRFGRRRPWIVLGTPVLLAGIWLVFLPTPPVSAAYLLAALAVLYLGWSLVILPYAAWGAELSRDYRERTRVAAVRQVFLMVGTIAAVSIQALPAALGKPGTVAAMALLGTVAIVAIPIAIVVLLALVPEPPPVVRGRVPWREGLRLVAGNAPFRRLLGAYFLNAVGGASTSSLFVLYVTHVLKSPDRVPLYLLVYFGVGIAGAPLWVWLAKRRDKHRVWIGSMVWASLWFATVPLIGPDEAWAYLVVIVATGISLSADFILPASMNADVVDLDAAEAGESRTGLFIALWEMSTKLAQAMGVAVALPLVAAFGFDPASTTNSPEALRALSIFYALAPALLSLSSIALMWNFPLGAAAHAAVRDRLALKTRQPAA